MKDAKKLLTPLPTRLFTLKNRVVMAPMSRRRSTSRIPSPSAPIYYGQRAKAGLIITENAAVAPNGVGYLDAPGIYSAAQLDAWKAVVEAVHARGGKIFVQLVHTGRIGHPLNHDHHEVLVAPSAVRADGLISVAGGQHLPMPEPHVLSTVEAEALIEAHVQAARSARAIGFDGVEVHGAHGFLPNQFLHPHTNSRSDRYGGSIANRSRFLLEIVERVSVAIGKDRTGIRLSPFANLNDLPPYPEEAATHRYITDALRELDILYIHLSAMASNGARSIPREHVKDVRGRFPNHLILAGGYTPDEAESALADGQSDLIAFGRPFISNPDLVERIRRNAPLTPWDEAIFYTGGDKGYIDYPEMNAEPEPKCAA